MLLAALDRELQFMVDLVLHRSTITPELINILLKDRQKRVLIDLVRRKPMYQEMKKSMVKGQSAIRELCFFDIIEVAVCFGHKSTPIIDMLKMMQNEVDKKGGRPSDLILVQPSFKPTVD